LNHYAIIQKKKADERGNNIKNASVVAI